MTIQEIVADILKKKEAVGIKTDWWGIYIEIRIYCFCLDVG